MASDKVFGILILLVSVTIIIIYGWVLFLTDYALLLLKITVFAVVVVVFGVLAWIGYLLASTTPSKPEDIEREVKEKLRRLKELNDD